MKFEFLFPGKTREAYLSKGIEEYSSRLQHYASVSVKVLKVQYEKGPDEVLRRREGRVLLDNVPKGALAVLLDARGKQCSSEGLARLLEKWRRLGKRQVSFLVGGPLGVSPEVHSRADEILSLSQMTFTHDMARLFLLEQLYRACTIQAGEKYHK